MPSKDKGLYEKYRVERTDGKDIDDPLYFVLDLRNDPGAYPAIVSYIDWCFDNGRETLGYELEELLDT